MASNSIKAFLFNTVRENRNPEPCLSTLSRFRTWHPTFKGLLSKKRLEKSHDPVDLKIYQVQKKNTITPKPGLRFFFSPEIKEKKDT